MRKLGRWGRKITSEWDRMGRVGATQASTVGVGPNSVAMEVSNPVMKASKGAAKAFLFAWWAGVITSFLGKDFDYPNVAYDQTENTMTYDVVPRGTA